ncbi:hypothetical protein HDU76_009927 [Blyttiomyces sp. JEL0837]|nr:hypothetical protein HDU76_009927 [Blyttiomyces sp. JEL0837]
MPPLQPFKLERYFAKYEFVAKYLLCSSDSQSLSVGDLIKLAAAGSENPKEKEAEYLSRLTDTWLGYTQTFGLPALRELISQKCYDGIFSEDHILVHAGAQEAIFTFCHAVLERGDVVIVQEPCYQSVSEIPKSIDCTVLPWTMNFSKDAGWTLSVHDLETLVVKAGPKLKAIFINTPHNPTGYQIPLQDFQKVINIAKSHNAWLFSDEVYRMLEPAGATYRLPPAATLYERAVSLNVMSKSFGMAGLRIGWAASQSRTLLEHMASVKDYTTICSSAPSETLSVIALEAHDEVLERANRIAITNLPVLTSFLDRHSDIFEYEIPRAGCITFVKVKPGVSSTGEVMHVDHMADILVRETGVLLLPGSNYGDDWVDFFRLGFGRENFAEALQVFDEWLCTRKEKFKGSWRG